MARVKVHGDAPLEAGAGDAEVLEAGFDEVVDHLVDAGGGLEEGAGLQELLHGFGVLGKTEEIGLLLGVMDGAAAVRAAAVNQLALGPEALAGGAVLALVGALVDIPVVVHLAEDALDGRHVVVVGRADEAVIGDVHELPQVQDAAGALDDLIHEGLGRDAGFLRFLLDLLAMLVRAGEEHHIEAAQPLVAGDGVGGDGAVGVADVKFVRGVVDRRGDEEGFFRHGYVYSFRGKIRDVGNLYTRRRAQRSGSSSKRKAGGMTELSSHARRKRMDMELSLTLRRPGGAFLRAIRSRGRGDGRYPWAPGFG